MARSANKDPLEPLAYVVDSLLAILVVALLFGFVSIPFSSGSMLGVGDSEVCVDNANIPNIGDVQGTEERQLIGLKPHASSYGNQFRVCNLKPSVTDQALSSLSIAPTFLVFFGFLFLTRRSIKHARTSGLFSADTARRVHLLGRVLLIGLIAAAVIEWIAKGLLLSTMVKGKGWADGPPYISIAALIGAIGIVTVGRVLERAVALQEEADATI